MSTAAARRPQAQLPPGTRLVAGTASVMTNPRPSTQLVCLHDLSQLLAAAGPSAAAAAPSAPSGAQAASAPAPEPDPAAARRLLFGLVEARRRRGGERLAVGFPSSRAGMARD